VSPNTKDPINPTVSKIGPENRTQIEEWLKGLTKVESSNAYWLNKGDIFSLSPSAVAQSLLESYEIGPGAQLFSSPEAKATFDNEFHASVINAWPANVLRNEIVPKGTSNGHPIKMQFLACPPNFNFNLHCHPGMELDIPIIGNLGERRLMGARLDPDFQARQTTLSPASPPDSTCYETPSDESILLEKAAIEAIFDKIKTLGTSGKFVERLAKEGSVIYNAVGSIHQTFTVEGGCLILAVWCGIHGGLDGADCGGIADNKILTSQGGAAS